MLSFMLFKKKSTPKLCRLQKEISRFTKCFFSLDIVFDVKHQVINFLAVRLDMDSGIFCHYMKPPDCLQYINAHLNHPWLTIKDVVTSISVRLSNLSASREVLNGLPRSITMPYD